MSITFQVSPVQRAGEPLEMAITGEASRLQGHTMEAMGASAPFLPSEEHGLLHAIHLAYAQHRPLALSPDAIWLMIAQGFALHVNANAERLRGKFVRHAGQKLIRIRRDDFTKGSPHNAWPEVFGAFSDAVAEDIGRQRDLVLCDFSTTGPVERAASEIVLLDSMQRYFRFELQTLCGIPEITLEGTVEDWRSIRRRAQALEEYELAWWTAALGPVLDELVATAEGRVDVRFWQTLFKHANESGGPYVRGWINVLLPYLRYGENDKLEQNPWVGRWRAGLAAEFDGGPSAACIPSGLSSVPFVWDYLGTPLPMRFLGGFVGVGQDEGTLVVRPVIGWAVRDDPAIQPVKKSLALIAGRVSSAQKLTRPEVEALVERVEAIGAAHGVALAYAPAGNFAKVDEVWDAKIWCFFAIGLRACAPGAASMSPISTRR